MDELVKRLRNAAQWADKGLVITPSVCLEAADAIEELSSADVRPAVRGRWKEAMQSCHDSPHVKCSVCGEYYWRYFKKFNFCPNCGADMREES